jgi:hypothetical protein
VPTLLVPPSLVQADAASANTTIEASDEGFMDVIFLFAGGGESGAWRRVSASGRRPHCMPYAAASQ